MPNAHTPAIRGAHHKGIRKPSIPNNQPTPFAQSQIATAEEKCDEPSPGQYRCGRKIACGYRKEGQCYVCLCRAMMVPISPETCSVNEAGCNWPTAAPSLIPLTADFIKEDLIREQDCEQRRTLAALRAANKPYPSVRYREVTLSPASLRYGADDAVCKFAIINEVERDAMWEAGMSCVGDESW